MAKVSRVDKREADASTISLDWRKTMGLGPAMAALGSMMDSERMHPVVLLHGIEGVGKRHLAFWMAARFVCVTGTACGVCGSCREVLAGIHPDVLVIDPEEATIKTAVMESFQTELDTLSSEGVRVGLILNCERMTREAANRMLKTLEEPPEHVRLILTTSRPRGLLPTVLGRCLKWAVPAPSVDQTLTWFQEVLRGHGRPAEDDTILRAWVRRAGASPGRLVRQIEDENDREAEILDRVISLVDSATPHLALQAAEDLARACRATVPEILAACEWALNSHYRQSAIMSNDTRTLKQHWSRRQTISKLRRLAVRGHVILNTQLAAEAIGLAGFGENE